MSTRNYTIRPVTSVEECVYFQQLERIVWSASDEDIMPIHTLITCVKNGGLILGAFAPDGPVEMGGMIGATFGWPGVGRDPTGQQQVKFCSHMAGVLPAWQGQGVGVQLKLAQRQAILALGYTDWITWTYDPLYRVNGVLNIHRLGAVCNTYYRNNYGVMTDALNAGVPSDRCQVDWWLNAERVRVASGEGRQGDKETRRQGEESVGTAKLSTIHHPPSTTQILPSMRRGDFIQPVEIEPQFDGAPVAVPIPDDIGAIRRVDGELSMAWRMYMRHILEAAFTAGYAMTDCVRIEAAWHYLLTPVTAE